MGVRAKLVTGAAALSLLSACGGDTDREATEETVVLTREPAETVNINDLMARAMDPSEARIGQTACLYTVLDLDVAPRADIAEVTNDQVTIVQNNTSIPDDLLDQEVHIVAAITGVDVDSPFMVSYRAEVATLPFVQFESTRDTPAYQWLTGLDQWYSHPRFLPGPTIWQDINPNDQDARDSLRVELSGMAVLTPGTC